MATPTGKGRELDAFNAQLRGNPEYRAFLQSMGVNPDGPLHLSGSQRSQAESWVRSRYPDLAGKFQIDPAGNINTDHGLSTAWSNPYFRYPLIAAGTVATAGALGVGPLAGALGGGGGGAAASAGAAAGTTAGAGTGTAVAAGTAAGSTGFWGRLGKFLHGPLGSQLVDTAGGLVATGIQASAANKAAEAQAQSLKEALDFEKQVYAEDKEFFKPWGDLGHGSAARLSEITSERRPPVTAESLWTSGQLPGSGDARPSVSAMTSAGSGRTPAAAAGSPWSMTGRQPTSLPPGARTIGGSQEPVSTTMPVREGGGSVGGTVRMQLTPTMVKDVPLEFVDTWKARGARVLEA